MSRKLVNFKAPKDTVEAAQKKLDHGEMSEKLRQRLEEIAHGTDVAEQTRIKDRLNQERQEKRQIDAKIERLRDQREEKERDIERLEERLDALMDQEGEYGGYLKSIEQDLHEGEHFFEGHAKIQEAAEVGDCTEKQVIQDLQERNPNVPETRFSPLSDVGR